MGGIWGTWAGWWQGIGGDVVVGLQTTGVMLESGCVSLETIFGVLQDSDGRLCLINYNACY